MLIPKTHMLLNVNSSNKETVKTVILIILIVNTGNGIIKIKPVSTVF